MNWFVVVASDTRALRWYQTLGDKFAIAYPIGIPIGYRPFHTRGVKLRRPPRGSTPRIRYALVRRLPPISHTPVREVATDRGGVAAGVADGVVEVVVAHVHRHLAVIE